MNNSVIGKTQENLTKRVNVELITDANILRKRVAKPNFCRGIPITDSLTVVQTVLEALTLNRPIYSIGAVKASYVQLPLQPYESQISTC